MEPRPPEDENTPVPRRRWRPRDSPDRNTMGEMAVLVADLTSMDFDTLASDGWS